MKKSETHISFEDERGVIIDLIEGEDINAVTAVTIKKGAVRGNHYHKETTQWNYVMSGKVKLISRIPGDEAVETILNKGDLAATFPNEHHAIEGMEDSDIIVFTKGPRGGKGYETDTIRLTTPLCPRKGNG